MNKEQLYAKWTFNKDVKSDIEAVIANEVSKAIEQEKPKHKYDKERFEAMYRAVVSNGHVLDNKYIQLTELLLQEVDEYFIK